MTFRYLQKTYKPKTFFLWVIALIVILHSAAFIIYLFDFPYYGNYILLDKQMEKLDSNDEPVRTIVVGDSSAGNGFDAALFRELSGNKTLNLALTGSYGLVGSLNMVKQARLRNPEIQNVVFIQTLDIWTRPFSREGFYKTEKNVNTKDIDSSFFGMPKLLDRLSYKTDLRWGYRFVRYAMGRKPTSVFENDYFHEAGDRETYRNGKRHVSKNGVDLAPIDPNKPRMYIVVDQYCTKEELNCIFLNGPIHEVTASKTDDIYFEQISNVIDSASSIHSFTTIFTVTNENMGDSSDHVDISYKQDMTKRYYDEIKDYLE